MNRQRRTELNKITALLEEAKLLIESVRESEQESFDNMPESLQFSEKGDLSQSAIDSMDNAVQSIEESIEYINESVQ